MSSIPAQLEALLTDPKITDLCFNSHEHLFVDRGNGLEAILHSNIFQTENDYRNFILEHTSLSGKTWDAKLPFLDTVFFQTHRAHIAFPPLARNGIYLSLRRLPQSHSREMERAQKEADARWNASAPAYEILKTAVIAKETVLIAGGTGSGKTTLLNDLLSFVPNHERIIALEDTAEINPIHPHFLGLLSRTANADGFGHVSLRELLRQTLRMRPDRILLGECRGDEVLDLLQALNTGHTGTLSTLHANSAKDALRRIELLGLIAARGNIPGALIKELLVHGIQKIVFMKRVNGIRTIDSIIGLEGLERETIGVRPIFPSAQSFQSSRSHPGHHRETPSTFLLG